MKEYEEIVAFLDQWGCFQKVVFFLLCVSIIPNGFGAFNLVFLTDVPDHHCFLPDLNVSEEWRKSIIPKTFDLVCDDQWVQPFTTSVFFIGVLVGSFFSGQLSDRYGRKPILFATLAAQIIFTFAQVFSTSWTMFVILLFFNGLGQISNFVAALVLGAEVLTDKIRILYSSMGTCLGFAVGYMLLPVVAYFLRDWKSLLVALSLPCLVYIPLWWLLPESPRWLLSQGRVKEAEAVIRKAARWNKVQTPTVIFETDSVINTKSDKKPSGVLDLFRISSIRITTLILLFFPVFCTWKERYKTPFSLGAVAAFVALLLLETFKQPLPETLQQMHKRQRTKCPCIQKTEASEPVVLSDSPL
ncbi:solute carrier family 22 member 4-like [Gambusia affinis]|uniref:solute carrier family 22 member 4-like n=1 Tax=Gambusia affinis TaxID=33528 RepID=UPI001CDBDF57|nr:solute carrier family 22 member 4-like [Gambusia affinis]